MHPSEGRKQTKHASGWSPGFGLQSMDGVFERKHFLGFATKASHGNLAGFRLALANYQKDRHFRQ